MTSVPGGAVAKASRATHGHPGHAPTAHIPGISAHSHRSGQYIRGAADSSDPLMTTDKKEAGEVGVGGAVAGREVRNARGDHLVHDCARCVTHAILTARTEGARSLEFTRALCSSILVRLEGLET